MNYDRDAFLISSHRAWMPNLWANVADQGAVYRNMAVSMAWCCPSRVSLLTGRLVHNSNITSSSAPNGGAAKFMRNGMDANSLGVWMQNLGYSTYFTGKYLNALKKNLIDETRCPMGWDTFEVSEHSVMSSILTHFFLLPYRESSMVTAAFPNGISSQFLQATIAKTPFNQMGHIIRQISSETRHCPTLTMRWPKENPSLSSWLLLHLTIKDSAKLQSLVLVMLTASPQSQCL
jgi:hypothetical protein